MAPSKIQVWDTIKEFLENGYKIDYIKGEENDVESVYSGLKENSKFRFRSLGIEKFLNNCFVPFSHEEYYMNKMLAYHGRLHDENKLKASGLINAISCQYQDQFCHIVKQPFSESNAYWVFIFLHKEKMANHLQKLLEYGFLNIWDRITAITNREIVRDNIKRYYPNCTVGKQITFKTNAIALDYQVMLIFPISGFLLLISFGIITVEYVKTFHKEIWCLFRTCSLQVKMNVICILSCCLKSINCKIIQFLSLIDGLV